MSNPKEKAAAMILKYTIILEYDFVSDLKWYPPNDKYRNERIKKDAKKCALIAVDEIIINMNDFEENGKLKEGFDKFEFWLEVKKEIELL